MNIGLLIIATGKYHIFVNNLISSARKFFLVDHNVTFYIFTDFEKIHSQDDVKIIKQEHMNWPYPTLFRYKIFLNSKDIIEKEDYLFYCDVDMVFVDEIKDKILKKRVATIHPSFEGGRGTPEIIHSRSKAFVSQDEKMTYFAGGFNGGTSVEYLKMCKILSENIDEDLKNNIIAIWHDESHMNRYFIDNPPTMVLDPGYCYPECFNYGYKKRIIALNKNHDQIRN